MEKKTNVVKEAIRKLGKGGQSLLARTIGIKPQSVQNWCATGIVPAKRVIDVERATGVSRHKLRPDLYPESKAA